MINLKPIERTLYDLKEELAAQGMTLQRILVDKTMPIKYELMTGKPYDEEPRIPCDPFTTLVVKGITIVGQDNELFRNHKEWPEDD